MSFIIIFFFSEKTPLGSQTKKEILFQNQLNISMIILTNKNLKLHKHSFDSHFCITKVYGLH